MDDLICDKVSSITLMKDFKVLIRKDFYDLVEPQSSILISPDRPYSRNLRESILGRFSSNSWISQGVPYRFELQYFK